MASVEDHISDEFAAWIHQQPMFFVGTAPLSGNGHVNLSPKGLDSFRVLDQHTVAWIDLTGSGAETIAHVRENGRVTMLFCAFSGPPRILRLYGRGAILLPGSKDFTALQSELPVLPGTRSIVRVRIDRCATSCGYGVPEMQFVEQRETLPSWASKRGPDGLAAYRAKHNAQSIDGLPGYPPAMD